MSGRLKGLSRIGLRLSISTALLSIAAIWTAGILVWPRQVVRADDGLVWVTARRVELAMTVVAGGDLQPMKETVIACEVEDLTDSDGTMIMGLIKNGSKVRKGDELCQLDSSLLVEQERQEEIFVNQARATHEQARLTLEVARTAFEEYEKGLVGQTTAEYQGKIALGRSDLQRQTDRLEWTEAMRRKGYSSIGVLLSEQQALAKSRHELSKSEREFEVFQRFTTPKELLRLKGEIETAAIQFKLEVDRLKTQEDRLAEIRKQVARCIVRAPHDGVVVHASRRGWWAPPMEEGARVYQGQALFKLPDLNHMEVEVSIHETMGPLIRAGMKAKVHIASMPEAFPAHVTHITLMPGSNWKEWDERLKHFIARVRLEKTPAGALPFMSASVEIETETAAGVLVIPVEAMSLIDGRQTCTVMAEDGPELRTINTRRATAALLEVIEGVDEGEQVALPRETGVGRVAARPMRLMASARG